MKKQNGFSQIVIMVVMLILAIALPVTANLVKKVQDNRSSATSETIYQGLICTVSEVGTTKCYNGTSYTCTNAISTNGPVWKKGSSCSSVPTQNYENSCSTNGSNGSKEVGRYSAISGKCYQCQGTSSGYRDIQVADSFCSSSGNNYENSCSTSGSNSSNKVGRYSAISGKCYQCQGTSSGYRDIEVASSNCPGITCAGQKDQCSGNYLQHCDGTKWVNITCKAGCDYSNDTCKDECTIGQAATCKDSTTREYCNKDADGGIRLKTQTCSNGCEGGNCKAAPAPVVTNPPAPVGCGASGTRRCDGKGTLQICNGTDWISQPVAAICEGTKAYNCDGNITVTNYFDCATRGQVCINGHCGDPSPVVLDPVCKPGAKNCLGNNLQVCKADGSGFTNTDCGSLGCNKTTKACNVCTPNCACATNTLIGQTCSNGCGGTCAGTKAAPVNGELGPANGTIVTTKPTSSGACSKGTVTWTDSIATDGKYNWTCAGINGGTSVSGSANKADCTVGNQKCTTGNKYYTCADGLWANSKTTTACATGKVCSDGDIGTAVCKDKAYVAPKLNLYFAISGVKKLDSCFGDLKFKVSVTKDGSNTVTSREVTATVVDNKFNNNLGDQVFKISNFALTNDYALTDKIKITIGSSRKTLTTIYGKDSQNSGFPALNKSQILVSSLVNNVLSLYNYPVLNGDIGTQGSLGTQDKVVNGADFAFMKNEWGKTCKSGENLNADLNGDCRVDTFDLQILKNAMAEQYSQKTD